MTNGLEVQRLTRDRSHPNHWFNRAADLRATAGAAWWAIRHGDAEMNEELGLPRGNDMRVACYPVYHMLCGLALELILKAVLSQRQTVPASHNLVNLAKMAGYSLSSKDDKLLQFYANALRWAGRYPIPRDCSDQKLREFYALRADVLTEPAEKLGDMQLYRSSGATGWDEFHALWLHFASDFKFQ